jgi:hypothetical protein
MELTQQEHSYQTFLTIADMELKRAERYRIFVSLLVLDLSFLPELFGDKAHEVVSELAHLAGGKVRCTDSISLMDARRMALLFPETPRQSAMLAARRLTEIMRRTLSEKAGRPVDAMIPVEIASYPDASGAKTLDKTLHELSNRNLN